MVDLSPAQAAFNELIRDTVAPLLCTSGFKRSGLHFERYAGDYRAYVGIQKSRDNTRDSVSFTMNLSVYSQRAVNDRMEALTEARGRWGSKVLTFAISGEWRVRIGELLPGGQDKWWTLDNPARMDAVADEVVEALSGFGLPVIERELQRPLTSPTYVVEMRGTRVGWHHGPDGVITPFNIGGERLFPLDSYLDAVKHREAPYGWANS